MRLFRLIEVAQNIALINTLLDEPHESINWYALADFVEEEGQEKFAAIFRQIGKNPSFEGRMKVAFANVNNKEFISYLNKIYPNGYFSYLVFPELSSGNMIRSLLNTQGIDVNRVWRIGGGITMIINNRRFNVDLHTFQVTDSFTELNPAQDDLRKRIQEILHTYNQIEQNR